MDVTRPPLQELDVAKVKSVGRDIVVRLVAGLLYTLANAPNGVQEVPPL